MDIRMPGGSGFDVFKEMKVCASADGKRLSVKVVNTHAQAVPLSLNLPDGFAVTCAMSVFADSLDAKNTMDSPDAVEIREFEFTASSLIIPAFPATVVEAGI